MVSLALMAFSDGLIRASGDHLIFMSPNINFVPQSVLSRIEVKIHADSCFGIEDPIQWLQLLSFKYSHMSCIQRQPTSLWDWQKLIWSIPGPQDFIPVHETIVSSLGSLRSSFLQLLGRLVRKMSEKVREYQRRKVEEVNYLNFCETSMRISYSYLEFSATFHNLLVQVINVQWYWLECDAWIHWNERILLTVLKPPSTPTPVDESLMGVFTFDLTAASKLFSDRIPVWLIRPPEAITTDTFIGDEVSLMLPKNLVLDTDLFGSIIYAGRSGDGHLAATSMGGHTYIHILKVFLSSQPSTSQTLSQEPASQMSSVATPSASQSDPVHSETRVSWASPCKCFVISALFQIWDKGNPYTRQSTIHEICQGLAYIQCCSTLETEVETIHCGGEGQTWAQQIRGRGKCTIASSDPCLVILHGLHWPASFHSGETGLFCFRTCSHY